VKKITFEIKKKKKEHALKEKVGLNIILIYLLFLLG